MKSPISRGGLLRSLGLAVVGALGIAGARTISAGSPEVEAANNDALTLGNRGNSATSPTGLAVTQTEISNVNGFGVADGTISAFAETATIAAYCAGTYNNVILADASASDADALRGISRDGYGAFGSSVTNVGVAAYTTSMDNPALEAENFNGPGIQVTAGGIGVDATATGSAVGVRGTSTAGTGLVGKGSIAGVLGTGGAVAGRGGEFAGGAAQGRLIPSSAKTHPKSGKAGDIFLDASHRLWLCTGGGRWKQLV